LTSPKIGVSEIFFSLEPHFHRQSTEIALNKSVVLNVQFRNEHLITWVAELLNHTD